MSWRVAKSLLKLRSQCNTAWPSRSKASDGSIGDAAHASRASDHNPWVKDGGVGVVTAIDITHDPADGADMSKLAEALRASKDPRIKYVIYNRRIFSSYVSGGTKAWTWRSYGGSNPHTKHLHLSVQPVKSLYDDVDAWAMPAVSKPKPAVTGTTKVPAFPLPAGHWYGVPDKDWHNHSGHYKASERPGIRQWQDRMKARGWPITPDGFFGPKSRDVAMAFQHEKKLKVDGLVGTVTWSASWTKPIT